MSMQVSASAQASSGIASLFHSGKGCFGTARLEKGALLGNTWYVNRERTVLCILLEANALFAHDNSRPQMPCGMAKRCKHLAPKWWFGAMTL